jgi:hypothetical protein
MKMTTAPQCWSKVKIEIKIKIKVILLFIMKIGILVILPAQTKSDQLHVSTTELIINKAAHSR